MTTTVVSDDVGRSGGALSTGAAGDRVTAIPRRRRLRWASVLALAAVMAYADGFWLTSLQGAVGAIERGQNPFGTWLRESSLMLPLFAIAVLWGLARAHRRFGPAPHRPRAVAAAALLVAAAGTVVGVGEVVTSSAYDYQLQSNLIRATASTHFHAAPAVAPGSVATDHAHGQGDCTGSCEARRATLAAHLTGVAYATPVLLATNLLLVGWVVALQGGRLDGSAARAVPGRRLWTGASVRRTIGA